MTNEEAIRNLQSMRRVLIRMCGEDTSNGLNRVLIDNLNALDLAILGLQPKASKINRFFASIREAWKGQITLDKAGR